VVAVLLYGGVALGTHWMLSPFGYHPATIAADKGGFQPTTWTAGWKKWLIPLVTAAGALVATTIVYWIAPETHGHGTDNAINSINTAPAGIRGRALPVRLVATAATIGSGGSGGTEGPTAQMAATTASLVARWTRLDYEQARVTVTAGLAAGVGAIFRAPLGGAMLGVELLFRDDSDPGMLVPSTISSFVAYLVFGRVFGYSPMFGHVAGLTWQLSLQLVAFPVLGICAGALARLFCVVFYRLAGWFERWKGPRPLRAAAAGLAVGLIGLGVPGVLGTGYGTIQDLLAAPRVLGLSIALLLFMPFAKLLATSLTVGSGASGGVFGPGMVIGATAGAAVWRLLEPLGLAPASPAPLVIIGIAACLGAASHAPIAITLIAAETCGSMSLIEPAVIALPLAIMVTGRRTLYMSQPTNRGELLRQLLKSRGAAPAETAKENGPLAPDARPELETEGKQAAASAGAVLAMDEMTPETAAPAVTDEATATPRGGTRKPGHPPAPWYSQPGTNLLPDPARPFSSTLK
jgi:CIC family chloride channel protein